MTTSPLPTLHTWLTSSLERNYPDTPGMKRPTWTIDAAKNEQFSFQMVVRHAVPLEGRAGEDEPLKVSVFAGAPQGWTVRIRRVGYVPIRHLNTSAVENEAEGLGKIPGFVPDPLFEEASMSLPANETHSFWFSVSPGSGVKAGEYELSAVLSAPGHEEQRCTVRVTIHDVTISRRRDFDVTNWFYSDSLLDFHGCTAFDESYWRILPKYLANMASHGQNVVYVPLFTPPLDGIRRPTQLLSVTRNDADQYAFDWRDVRRYLSLARDAGIEKFEWTHLFTQWGAKNALRIYEDQGRDEKLLWEPETGATSAAYRSFLSQFLPEFQRFLQSENLLSHSFFHLSDEPHGDEHRESYRNARELLRQLAPWMKVMDALSEIEFAEVGMVDLPVPSISSAIGFVGADIPCWCYYCCGPRGRFVQRLMDTPLAKIRMNGWLLYRWPFHGFLHWGYNYWYQCGTRTKIDPFATQDGGNWPGWAAGDCFMVYPGENGPLDSIRWEVFSESLQDYALLQTLDVPRNSFSELRDFEDFPKSAEWILKTRRGLLSGKIAG